MKRKADGTVDKRTTHRKVATPDDLNFQACEDIAELMSGKQWGADTLAQIADILRDVGYTIKDVK